MKRFEKNRKTILFLCYLPMILFIGLLWNTASRQIHSQLFSTLADLARQNRYVVSYSINQKMEELERVAQGLAQREDFPQGVAIDDLATVANVLGFREIGVTGLDGMARMSTDTSYDITGREYFQMSVQGFNWVSKTLCDMRDGKKVNVCSMPVRSDSGAVIGTLLGTIETDEFFASMQVPSFHEQGYAYVVNQDGDVVLTTRSDGVEVTNFCTLLYQNPGNVDQLNQLRDCLAGKTESVNLLVNEDERHYINVSWLGYDDLWLVTGVPEHALDSGIMAQFKVIQVLSVVFAVAGLAGLFFLNLIMDRNDRHLRKLAYVDARTGIHNHFYLRETMGEFTTLGPGKGKRVAVLLFNIQQFKNINNLYGSVAGDQVLKHVAQHLSAVFGEGRTLARDTADSFVVLSPYEDWNQLLEQAETLCADLPLLPFNNNEIGVKLRCGIYRLPDGVQPDEEALFRARMACFEAPARAAWASTAPRCSRRWSAKRSSRTPSGRPLPTGSSRPGCSPSSAPRPAACWAPRPWPAGAGRTAACCPRRLHRRLRGDGHHRRGGRDGSGGRVPPDPGLAGAGHPVPAGVGEPVPRLSEQPGHCGQDRPGAEPVQAGEAGHPAGDHRERPGQGRGRPARRGGAHALPGLYHRAGRLRQGIFLPVLHPRSAL